MNNLILKFSLLLILLISFGCGPAMHNIKFDCTYSKSEIVTTKENAIEIATNFLEQRSTTGYYRDSVSVEQYDNGDYHVSFIKKDFVMPPIISLMVRKDDGCVAIVPLK